MYPLAGLVNIFTDSQFIRDSASVTSLHYRAHVLRFSATNLTWQLILYLIKRWIKIHIKYTLSDIYNEWQSFELPSKLHIRSNQRQSIILEAYFDKQNGR